MTMFMISIRVRRKDGDSLISLQMGFPSRILLERRFPSKKSTYNGRFPFIDSSASCVNPYIRLSFNPSFVVRAAVKTSCRARNADNVSFLRYQYTPKRQKRKRIHTQ